MTKNEIVKRIAELDRAQFMLMMADHWTQEDYRANDEYDTQIRALKEMLEKMG